MKKKSMKVKILELSKKQLQLLKGGNTQEVEADLEEVVVTGKKKSSTSL